MTANLQRLKNLRQPQQLVVATAVALAAAAAVVVIVASVKRSTYTWSDGDVWLLSKLANWTKEYRQNKQAYVAGLVLSACCESITHKTLRLKHTFRRLVYQTIVAIRRFAPLFVHDWWLVLVAFEAPVAPDKQRNNSTSWWVKFLLLMSRVFVAQKKHRVL
jgi:hypothetical protein